MVGQTKKVNFRELKKGSLVQLVEGSQSVIFERFSNYYGINDGAVFVYLDPIDGLVRKEVPLNSNESSVVKTGEHRLGYIDPKSGEGRKYLKLLRGTK